jgi:hypothetical protein
MIILDQSAMLTSCCTRYKRSDRSVVTTSPMGRQTTVLFDKLGRAVDADGWSQRPLDDAGLASVVTGVLNNLLGYPHGREAAWSSFITVSPAVVSALLDKILALHQG